MSRYTWWNGDKKKQLVKTESFYTNRSVQLIYKGWWFDFSNIRKHKSSLCVVTQVVNNHFHRFIMLVSSFIALLCGHIAWLNNQTVILASLTSFWVIQNLGNSSFYLYLCSLTLSEKSVSSNEITTLWLHFEFLKVLISSHFTFTFKHVISTTMI